MAGVKDWPAQGARKASAIPARPNENLLHTKLMGRAGIVAAATSQGCGVLQAVARRHAGEKRTGPHPVGRVKTRRGCPLASMSGFHPTYRMG